MAYAAALFADSCLRGLNGTPTIECTYVESAVTDAPYFASKCKLSTEGGCGAWGRWAKGGRCTVCGPPGKPRRHGETSGRQHAAPAGPSHQLVANRVQLSDPEWL